jgi:redox-sensitive bicupin YhaK (pirin superfamily)
VSAVTPLARLELRILPRARDIGGFGVRRVLPFTRRRQLGPFVFLDQLGPTELAAGTGVDVPPHPHIGLATVTYLWEGEIDHRDSLGTFQTIRPGEINWMTAGQGIVHSERTPAALRAGPHRLHGIQLWVALPQEREEMAPEFQHHSAATLPRIEQPGVSIRLLAGAAFGASAPVRVYSPLAYADVELEAGAQLVLPPEYSERAVYLLQGALQLEPGELEPAEQATPQLLVFHPGAASVQAVGKTRLLLLAGEPLGERHMWWNFVSSSAERIQRAKRDWNEGRFPLLSADPDTKEPPAIP